MALSLKILQALEKVGLDQYFENNRPHWLAAAQSAHDYCENNFAGATIRQDDVFEPLLPIVERHQGLQATLSQKKLTQQYWFKRFTYLVIDRCWAEITGG